MKSVLDGYLTPACKDCPCWQDGTKGWGYGCGSQVPIHHCPDFAKVMEEEEKENGTH